MTLGRTVIGGWVLFCSLIWVLLVKIVKLITCDLNTFSIYVILQKQVYIKKKKSLTELGMPWLPCGWVWIWDKPGIFPLAPTGRMGAEDWLGISALAATISGPDSWLIFPEPHFLICKMGVAAPPCRPCDNDMIQHAPGLKGVLSMVCLISGHQPKRYL